MNDFVFPIRIYYEDTDAGGMVYHANYLKFFERARTEMLRSKGFEQDALRVHQHILFAVRSLQIDYVRSAYFNELLHVHSKIIDIKKVSLTFEQTLKRADEVVCSCTNRIACLDAHTFRPKVIPDLLLNQLTQ